MAVSLTFSSIHQALWLSQAYLLEFLGQEVFVKIWGSSLVLLAVHAVLLVGFIKAWANFRVEHEAVHPAPSSATKLNKAN